MGRGLSASRDSAVSRRGCLLGVAASLLAGCAGPPELPKSPESLGVAISVEARTPWGLSSSLANRVYFLRIDDDARGVVDFSRGELFTSNYTNGDYVFLLDTPPGRYVAVACQVRAQDHWRYTFFSREIVQLTEVTAEPSQITYMGRFSVDEETDWDEADEMSRNSRRAVGAYGGFLFHGTLRSERRDAKARASFLADVRKLMIEGGWGAMLD
jgi:hypothetical protein